MGLKSCIARSVAVFSLLICALSGVGSGLARSQTTAPTNVVNPSADPPGRVARLNYFDGVLTFKPSAVDQWSYAQLNRPLTTGDQLWADKHTKAELQLGSIALRLNQSTALDFVALNDQLTQFKLTQGTLAVHMHTASVIQPLEIDTPNLALQLNGAAVIRLDVASDGSSTTVTVRRGTATVYGDGVSLPLVADQKVRFTGTHLQETAGELILSFDEFDGWVAARDHAEDKSISARYVSREIPGYTDLDNNGVWRTDPAYGPIWVPTIAVTSGWAPYRVGHWSWIAPWGWTWVDDAPWGFAPFHYGRWAYIDQAWAWVPGPLRVIQPVYAPALVGFVGSGSGGSHWSLSLSIGAGVGWVPLGPGEAWTPAYEHSPTYYQRINNGNITNLHNTINNINNTTVINHINKTYINQTVPGALTAVPTTTFVQGQSVAQAAQPITAQQLSHFKARDSAPPIAPVSESLVGNMRPAPMTQPKTLAQQPVIAIRTPTALNNQQNALVQPTQDQREHNQANPAKQNQQVLTQSKLLTHQPIGPLVVPVSNQPKVDNTKPEPSTPANMHNHETWSENQPPTGVPLLPLVQTHLQNEVPHPPTHQTNDPHGLSTHLTHPTEGQQDKVHPPNIEGIPKATSNGIKTAPEVVTVHGHGHDEPQVSTTQPIVSAHPSRPRPSEHPSSARHAEQPHAPKNPANPHVPKNHLGNEAKKEPTGKEHEH